MGHYETGTPSDHRITRPGDIRGLKINISADKGAKLDVPTQPSGEYGRRGRISSTVAVEQRYPPQF